MTIYGKSFVQNVETGEITEVELTPDEIKQRDIERADGEAWAAQVDAINAAKETSVNRLQSALSILQAGKPLDNTQLSQILLDVCTVLVGQPSEPTNGASIEGKAI